MKLLRFTPALFLLIAALTARAQQTQEPQPPATLSKARQADLHNALAHLDSGKFSSMDVAIIMGAHDLDAIPELETQFTRCTNPELKESLADALIRLGQNHGPYWNYMIDRANQALSDPPPTPFALDADGKITSGVPHQLAQWAAQHHMSTAQAMGYAMLQGPAPILRLSFYKDPRAIPILRKALHTDNFMLTLAAARGLADMRDNASIPTIIQLCRNSPKDLAKGLALALIEFDDPRAQHTADLYLPKAEADKIRAYLAKSHQTHQ